MRAAVDLDDGHVDAVERRAAHDAGYTHARLNSSCNSAQQAQRLDGPQLIHVQIADALGDAVIERLEKLDLHGLRGLRRARAKALR